MFQEILVPSVPKTGIIIPILKKSTLDPNVPNNYRPITLSSTHGKLIEFLILPQDTAHSNQFGYREGRGTSMACTFINDLLQYCSVKGSNVFICSLDAEKCFDSIWHEGLFYKLLDILPKSHGYFFTGGINLWNVSCDGTEPTANVFACSEVRNRAVSYRQPYLIYLSMISWLNCRRVVSALELKMSYSTLSPMQTTST